MAKHKKIICVLAVLALFGLVNFVLAQPLDRTVANEITSQADATRGGAGYAAYGAGGIGQIVGLVIKAFLGLLGVIFIYLIVLAGYNWMTAAGDEQKVEKAKDQIKRAVIGLVIVVSAYAITYFVLQAMSGVANPVSSPYGTVY